MRFHCPWQGFNSSSTRRGVTALEMLIALAFISIAFLAILRVLSSSLVSSSELRGSVMAQNLANHRMEEIMSREYEDITAEALSTFTDYPEYSFVVSVSSVESHLKSVTVTIYWEVAGAEMSYTVDTLISNW